MNWRLMLWLEASVAVAAMLVVAVSGNWPGWRDAALILMWTLLAFVVGWLDGKRA